MKKFCCTKFEFLYSGEKNMGLNIRIIKFSNEFMERSQGLLKENNVTYITEGYENDINNCRKKIVIEFCPFCGKQINKTYKDDKYAQEII